MDAKTLEALKASIAKWERNAEATDPSDVRLGSDECPLCDVFHMRAISCNGCPVSDRTGRPFCVESPYISAWNAWFLWNSRPENTERRDRAHAAARDEVAFLKSLLPEETP